MNSAVQKPSPAINRTRQTLSVIPWAYRRQAERASVSTLRAQLPPALLVLLNWRAGEAIRLKANGDQLQCTGVSIPCSLWATCSLKKSRLQRVQFDQKWAKASIQLRREPKSRRWSVETSGRLAPINSIKPGSKA